MPTTSFQAGVESNDVELSYAKEAAWGTKPAVAFKAIRYTGESFSGSKSRARPAEIRTDYQAAAAVTTQEAASAGVNFAFSSGTYDDLLAGVLGGDFSTAIAISGTDIAGTATGYSTVTAGKFTTVTAGIWIRVSGFSNAANNGYKRVTAATGTTITTAQAGAVEAAGPSVTIGGSRVTNGTSFQSFHFQKKLASALYLVYPGTFFSGVTLTASTGQFLTGSFSGLSKIEEKQTTNQSTGAVTAAPTGRVVDSVAGFQGLEVNNAAISAVVDGITLNVSREGAAAQYGLGSTAAQGVLRGTVTVSGSVRIYFRDFTMYDLYKSEAYTAITYRTVDSDGAGYQITLPSATIMNPSIVAGGPGQSIMAEFALEGNISPTLGYTLAIDKF
jgi:hypothetical protein